jgi:transcriptional regulator with XRE-family HTH domain
MTPEDFRAWLQRRGWSTSQAAEALGIKAQQIQRYLAGTTPVPQYCTYTVTCIGYR